MKAPLMSIIVPTYNSQDYLEKCLKAIKKSIFTDYELIVVDTLSVDSTVSIAKKYADKVIQLDQRVFRSKARNIAANSSAGSIIIGIDSDIVVKKTALQRIVNHFSLHSNIDALTGLLSKEHPNNDFFSQYKNLYMNFIFKRLPDTITFLYGSIHAIRRRVLDLYHSEFGLGEDTAIGQQLTHYGKKISFLRNLEVIHLKKYSFISFVRNNFLIPFHWAKIFIKYRGWKQLPKFKSGFAHCSKSQILSLIVTIAILFLSFALFTHDQYFAILAFSILFWLVLNMQFFIFLVREKGFWFAFLSLFLTFFDNVVMFLGALCGFLSTLKPSHR